MTSSPPPNYSDAKTYVSLLGTISHTNRLQRCDPPQPVEPSSTLNASPNVAKYGSLLNSLNSNQLQRHSITTPENGSSNVDCLSPEMQDISFSLGIMSKKVRLLGDVQTILSSNYNRELSALELEDLAEKYKKWGDELAYWWICTSLQNLAECGKDAWESFCNGTITFFTEKRCDAIILESQIPHHSLVIRFSESMPGVPVVHNLIYVHDEKVLHQAKCSVQMSLATFDIMKTYKFKSLLSYGYTLYGAHMKATVLQNN